MQSVKLKVSGIYTAPSDYSGLPEGALDEAMNVESRYKDLIESRRGFKELRGSGVTDETIIRAIDFPINGVDRVILLSSGGNLYYYDAGDESITPLTGINAGITPIDVLAKNRFIRGGQNLYLTGYDGVLSKSSGTDSKVIRAGVPVGLDCYAALTTDSSGFFGNNEVVSFSGDVTNSSSIVTHVSDLTSVVIGQYIAGTNIPAGSTVTAITHSTTVLTQTGNTTIGSTSLSNLTSNTGLVAGLLITGSGIPTGTKVSGVTGSGPYTVTMTNNATATATGSSVTFLTQPSLTISNAATGTATAETITTYTGSGVAYRVVWGRVEYDDQGNAITRLSAPSSQGVVYNTLGHSTNVTVTATIPKNSSDEITFVQIYRSAQTAAANIIPLDQMVLVYERDLTGGDFAARVITYTDETNDDVLGTTPLYTGTNEEGIAQSNNPPPACFDMCIFRDFALYANTVQPSQLDFTILGVGSPNGVQVGDTITVTVTGGSPIVFTASASEDVTLRHFKVFNVDPAQDIANTAISLVKCINYWEALEVHAVYTSGELDLPGKISLIGDYPQITFSITASAHTSAYDPVLSNVASTPNKQQNAIYVSKSGKLQSVPLFNEYSVADASYPILRIIALRDYVIILKADGIYKLVGTSPDGLRVLPFDLTTKIVAPDAAVALNSGVWMLSNQGVVSVSDAGVNAVSIPVDNQINDLIQSHYDNVNKNAFAVGYESDRKYVLFTPDDDVADYSKIEYVYNYVTNSWTNWNRQFQTAFVHSKEGNLYVARHDTDDKTMSKERKTGSYHDYVDEGFVRNVSSIVTSNKLILDDITNVGVGDIIYQDESTFSPIIEVNVATNEITTQYSMSWLVSSAIIYKAINCTITWKQVYGDNPAYQRQYSEGLILFKSTQFNSATLSFITDFSNYPEYVELAGQLLGAWGLFPWGQANWGGVSAPKQSRFIIPAQKQLGSYIIPSLNIQQGWSDFKIQGLSISYNNVSQEVGR